METTIRKAKKVIAEARAKVSTAKELNLTWEAKRLLQLYAQGYTDWQYPPQPWRLNYEQALKDYGKELSSQGTVSRETLYWLSFFSYFRGQPDKKKQRESELEFWLLARTIAPKPTEELLLHKGLEHLYTPEDIKARKEFLVMIDNANAELAELPEAKEEPASGVAP